MRSREWSLVLAATVFLAVVALALTACGTAPSDSIPPVASPTSSAPAPTSTFLPAVGSSIVLTSTDATVPDGKLLEVRTGDQRPSESEYSLLDPHAQKGYREMASPCPTPGYSIMTFDETGHRTMDGVTLEVYPDASPGEHLASYSQIVLEDPLAGKTASVTGTELLDGLETVVAQTTLSAPGGPSVTVTVNIDPATGFRVRETWKTESQISVTTRKLVDATPELAAKLDKQSILAMAATFRSERAEKLKTLSYPVLGLPNTSGTYKLLWIIPGLDWGNVRLEYELSSSPGHPSATVITRDLKTNPNDARLFTTSRRNAVAQSEEGSDVLRFREGDTGIQVQASKEVIGKLTAELVQVGGLPDE
jgi:hypothetical protein